jgi:GDP-6-deoxy-D-talose 4-dehydrogenase
LKVLVTGADGFTGIHFTQHAVAAGHEIVPLESNLTDKAAVYSEVADCRPEAVVHLAAISFVGHSTDNDFYSVNVIGTANLLGAIARLDSTPFRVILASSANVYGNCNYSPISETQIPKPINHYAMSKLAMDYIAETFLDQVPIVITRPFNYTGPGQSKNFVIAKLVDHFSRREPIIELGNLNVEREFNDIDMVCQAYLNLIRFGKNGETYNVCSGETYSLGYVISVLEGLSNHSLDVRVNSSFVRKNEVHRLCGNPSKLKTLLQEHNTSLQIPRLEQTLQRMLR